MWVAALAALASSIGSAAIAAYAKNASEEQARQILMQARTDYGKLDVPALEKLAGEALGPTELSKVQTDPRYAQAQMNALTALEERGHGGMTLSDQAAENEAMNRVGRQVQAQNAATRDSALARGTLGSGAELAMELQNNQAGANRANSAGMDAAAHAQQRAYDSIIAGGNLAGQMRSQDYNEKSRAAQAQDAINRYNATRMPEAYKTAYQMQMQKLAGMNGQNPNLAASYRNQGNTDAALAGGVGTAANGALTTLAANSNGTTDTSSVASPENPDDTDYLERARRQGAY